MHRYLMGNESVEYRTGKTLMTYSHEGMTWATLKEAVHIRTGKQYFCKVISREGMRSREHLVRNEVTALRRIQNGNPNIMKLYGYVETLADEVRLYLDFCSGGTLSERITNYGAYSEAKAAALIRTILKAVKYMHNAGVVHRDLTPESIFFRGREETAPVVIAEFGLSRLVEEAPYSDNDPELYGSHPYLAPEILLKESHGKAVDVWQVGILAFFSLTGDYTPFSCDTSDLQKGAIAAGQYLSNKWDGLSANARDFIAMCLTHDPDRRPGVEEVLTHMWLIPSTPTRGLRAKSRSNLSVFNAERKWRIAGIKIKAINRFLTGRTPPPLQLQEQSQVEDDTDQTVANDAQIIIIEPEPNEDDNDYSSPGVSPLFDQKFFRRADSISTTLTDEDKSTKSSLHAPSQENLVPLPESYNDATEQADPEVSKSSSEPASLYTSEARGTMSTEGIQSDTGVPEPPISTFVLYTPHVLSDDRAAVTPEETQALENDFPEGGVVLSTHSSPDAEGWVEAHYHDPEFESLRATGLRGPISGMLSPEEPALILFGSILNDEVLSIANALADMSGFVVMVRPVEDDPTLKFSESELSEDSSSPVSSLSTFEGEGEEDPSDDAGENSPQPEYKSTSVSEGPAWRLRGGHGEDSEEDDSDSPWTSEAHGTVVWLNKLWPDKKQDYSLGIRAFTTFTVQPAGRGMEARSEVIGHVRLNVETRTRVLPDRSYTSIGFLVYRQGAIIDREFIDCGFDYPDQILKSIRQLTIQKNAEVTAGYASLHPTATAKLSYTRTRGETVEYADNKPMPRCQIIHDPGERWNKDGKSYSSYDITTVPGQNPTSGQRHPLKAEYAMGINIHPRYISDRPKISFVTRNQIIIWISDPNLKAKARGLLILMTTYIPNIRTRKRLMIDEELNVHPAEDQTPETGPAQAVPVEEDAALSLSVAPVGGKDGKNGKNPLLELFADVRRKLNFPSKEPALADLLLQEYIARGWDASNEQWRGALWTSLDKDLRVTSLDRNPATPVWKLKWDPRVVEKSSEYEGGGASHKKPEAPPEVEYEVTAEKYLGEMGNDVVGTSSKCNSVNNSTK